MGNAHADRSAVGDEGRAGRGLRIRAGAAMALVLVAFLLLAGRLGQMQISQGAEYRRLADQQQMLDRELAAWRGRILDSRGRLLASTVQRWSVYADPQAIADPDGALNEVTENNNVLTKDIQVKPIPPSLVADPDDADMEQRHALYGLMGTPPSAPSVYHTWQEVRLESGSYVVKKYWARLTTVFTISPDTRIAYTERPRVMESGFGYSVSCSTVITTNYDRPEKLTGAQMVWMRSPESAYGQLSNWQDVRDSLAVKTGNPGDAAVTWQLKANPWSAIDSRLHFVPLWFPDGEYTALAQAFYGWSPVGQLFDFKTDTLVIDGDMYDRVTTVRWR